jgi:hypothetical protein
MTKSNNGNLDKWVVEIRDLIFEGKSVFNNEFTAATIDPGTEFSLFPLKEMQSIVNIMEEKFKNESFTCGLRGLLICGFINTKCSDIELLLDSYKIQLNGDVDFNVPPADYLI